MDINANDVVNILARRIGELAKENAILETTINELTKPKDTNS